MATPLRRRFGAHLKDVRTTRQLTQDQLAERGGLSVDTVRRIERGAVSPSLDTLAKLAKGLGMSMTAMFGYFETGQRDFVSEITVLLAERPARDVTLAYDVVRAVLEARDRK